jgi:hypothetical protein
MPFFSTSDINELSNAWSARRNDAFNQKVEDDFVQYMINNVPIDLKDHLLHAISIATKPGHLSVVFGDVQFDADHLFYAEGWGNKRLTLRQVLRNTQALSRISEYLGPNMGVSYHYADNKVFFTVDFWAPRPQPHVIRDPCWDMPPLEVN